MTAETGRVALVTGGSRGIGRAIVVALAARGLRVAFTYREQAARAEELADELEARHGARPLTLAFDQETEDGTAVVAEVLAGRGSIDSLVLFRGDTAYASAKAGLFGFGRSEEIATAAAFLSEDATYMTGGVLVCDSGFSL